MNTTFKTLIENYSTYEALSTWLRSPEGGSLVIRDEHLTPEQPLVIIHYLKGRSDLTCPHVPAFRSVVWNIRTNRPVCAAPARGLRFSNAVDNGLAPGSFTTEDFVDGVMISMFHDGTTWRLATRTQLDAGSQFYGKRPFAELFAEALAATGLSLESFTDTSLQYSWVLQHPEERIVVAAPYGIPQLRLVELSQFFTDCTRRVIWGRDELRAAIPLANAAADKLLPALHEVRTLEEVKERVVAWGRRFGAGWQGVCLKDPATGQRWKLRSDQYDEARHLRGNQAKRQFLWLERWSEGRLPAYLKLYPEEACAAEELIASFKACTTEFHAEYLRVYKERACRLGEVTPKWRKLLWEARQAGVSSYFAALRDFLNGQDTARKLWLVNFETRYGTAPVAEAEAEAEATAT